MTGTLQTISVIQPGQVLSRKNKKTKKEEDSRTRFARAISFLKKKIPGMNKNLSIPLLEDGETDTTANAMVSESKEMS